jgi:hypothetical protein
MGAYYTRNEWTEHLDEILLTTGDASITKEEVRALFADFYDFSVGRVLRLDQFGGRGKKIIGNFLAPTIEAIEILSSTVTRFHVAENILADYIPGGAGVYINDPANPGNQGTFFVQGIGAGIDTIDVRTPSGQFVANPSPSGVVFEYLDVRIDKQNLEYDEQGDPNPGVPFDNATAWANLLADQFVPPRHTERPFSIVIDLGDEIWPSSWVPSLRGYGNILITGAGKTAGGVFWLDNSVSADKPHFFHATQNLAGDINTQRVVFKSFYAIANQDKQPGVDLGTNPQPWGIISGGRGDFIHMEQKKGSDFGAASLSRFDGPGGGVDPQIDVLDCKISGAPRIGVYIRGRGDSHVEDCTISSSGLNNLRLQIADSKVRRNIMTTSGSCSKVYEEGTDNVQESDNLDYFNARNHYGSAVAAPTMSVEDQMAWLSTVYYGGAQIKSKNCRYEDGPGPHMCFGKVEVLEFEGIEFNHIGTIGVDGSDRDSGYWNSNLPGTALDWFGITGVPCVIARPGMQEFATGVFKGICRGGRNGNAMRRIMEFGRSTNRSLWKDVEIDFKIGHFTNSVGNPKITEPTLVSSGNWTQMDFQHWTGEAIQIDETQYQQPLRNWLLKVDGVKHKSLHGRSRKAWHQEEVNVHDDLVVFETAAPKSRTITAVTKPNSTTTRYTFTDGQMANGDRPDFHESALIAGLANAANNGYFRVEGYNVANDYIEVYNPAGVADASPAGGSTILSPAYGTFDAPVETKKARGQRTRYLGKLISPSSNTTDVGYVLVQGLGGTVTSFIIDRTGMFVDTIVDGDDVEQIVPSRQLLVMPDAALTLRPEHFGKMLAIPATTARAITSSATGKPDGWFVDILLTGAGSLTMTGPINAATISTQYQARRLQKVGSDIIQIAL